MYDDENGKAAFHERRFLNKKHGRAYTIARVDKDLKPKVDRYNKQVYWSDTVSAYLEIGDCSDDACLEFTFRFSNKKSEKKAVKKLDKFIESCVKMRAAMVKDNKKLRKKYKKFKKAEKKRLAKAKARADKKKNNRSRVANW